MRPAADLLPENDEDTRWHKHPPHDERKRRRHDEENLSSATKSVQSLDDGDQERSFFSDVVMSIINDQHVSEMKCALEPLVKLLDESGLLLQREAEEITGRREAEDKEIRDETERLTAEVTRIQSTISQFMDTYQKQT